MRCYHDIRSVLGLREKPTNLHCRTLLGIHEALLQYGYSRKILLVHCERIVYRIQYSQSYDEKKMKEVNPLSGLERQQADCLKHKVLLTEGKSILSGHWVGLTIE